MIAYSEFIGRNAELEQIECLWQSNNAELVLIEGRRRIGKTRLLKEWINNHPDRPVLYWKPEISTSPILLRQLSQAVYDFTHQGQTMKSNFSYPTWENAFQQLVNDQLGRFVVIFDDLPSVTSVEPGLPGILKKVWTGALSKANVLMILSGHQSGLMYPGDLINPDYQKIELAPLPYALINSTFLQYTPLENLVLYSVFGGIPYYLSMINPQLSLAENIREVFHSPTSPASLESDYILGIHNNNRSNTYATLDAIAQDFLSLEEIAQYTGMSNDLVATIVNDLVSSGNITSIKSSKNTNNRENNRNYSLNHPYLRYLFTCLRGKEESFDSGIITRIEDQITSKHTWPKLCMDWMDEFIKENGLTCDTDRKAVEWDDSGKVCYVINEDPLKRVAIIGGCFWKNAPVSESEMIALVIKASGWMSKKEDWAVHLVLFSKSGYTGSAAHLSTTIKMRLKGEQFIILSCRNVELSEL